jgi:3-mercaptopyruvate sulfurtransferase SseA
VARELRRAGWPRARALAGGWAGWQAGGLPVEPKPDSDREPAPRQ